MPQGFTLSVYPWVYLAKYREDGSWAEDFQEKPHKTPREEEAMAPEELDALLTRRNSFPELPVVNYTTQYGLGCFEGLKAFPQADGGLRLFRPDQNAKRFARSMEGLKMPIYPEETFVSAVRTVVASNLKLGFAPRYDASWERDDFESGDSVYIRPFTYSEPAVGLGLSHWPWVVMVTTPVGSYFRPGNSKAVTADTVRATPGGTGWIKCDANYVAAILAKKRAEAEGFMEAVFLDATHRRYVEEGSSCNIFFVLSNGLLVTPDLGDTILPGVTRDSVLTLAADLGIKTEVRRIAIDEVMTDAREAFVTGTAAGVTSLESLTHKGKTAVFSKDGSPGEVGRALQKTLKGIQYGALPDRHGWMTEV